MQLNGDPSTLAKASSSALNNTTRMAQTQIEEGKMSADNAIDNMKAVESGGRITKTAAAIRKLHGMGEDLANQGAKQGVKTAGQWTNL